MNDNQMRYAIIEASEGEYSYNELLDYDTDELRNLLTEYGYDIV